MPNPPIQTPTLGAGANPPAFQDGAVTPHLARIIREVEEI
jgi:hypothetical protein